MTTFTAEQFIASPAFMETTTSYAAEFLAIKHGVTVDEVMTAVVKGVPSITSQVLKLVTAAAEHAAELANAGKL